MEVINFVMDGGGEMAGSERVSVDVVIRSVHLCHSPGAELDGACMQSE